MMNNTNNGNNSNGVGPYRATSNMNTYIDTPNANFNGMMNVNIQSGTTNSSNHGNNVINSNNKPKKKTMTLNLGPEFKIAFLIVVILLVFVFLLPYISELIRGY